TSSGTIEAQTLFTNIQKHPSSGVPGVMGASFGPGTGETQFDRDFGSPNGNYAFSADTDLAGSEDEVILLNGVVVVREGTPAEWTMGENVGLLDTKLGINNDGTLVFATNTDGPTTSDEYIVQRTSGGVF